MGLEKAFAKFFGSYKNIDGGSADEAAFLILGRPVTYQDFD